MKQQPQIQDLWVFHIHQSCSALNDPFAGQMTRRRQQKQNSKEGRPSGANFKWQILLTLKQIPLLWKSWAAQLKEEGIPELQGALVSSSWRKMYKQ